MGTHINKNLKALVENHNAPPEKRRDIVVLEGGTRSGKTVSALMYLISCCAQEDGVRVAIFRGDSTTNNKTIIPDFQMVMSKLMKMWEDRRWNKTEKIYSFANGSRIEFLGANETQKLHGLRCDYAFFNEAMEIPPKAWSQVQFRTTRLKLIDFNPSLSHHWVFSKVISRGPEEVLHVRTTFRDNPHLTRSQVREILSYDPSNPVNVTNGTADRYMWDVYGLGRRGRREGVIFPNIETIDYWPERHTFIRWGYGLDFGFSMDPSALVECGIHQDCLLLRQHVYEDGLIVSRHKTRPDAPSLEARMDELKIDKDAKIACDNARPESIRELRLAGYNAVPCPKGKNSIVHGISLMKNFKIKVYEGSVDLLTEFENYVWDKRKSDDEWKKDTPIDKFNHGIDGARYWALMELRPAHRKGKKSKKAKAKSRRHV